MAQQPRPEFNDIDGMVKQYFMDEFGSSIDLDDPTTAGMFAGVISKVADSLEKTFEGGINSLFVLRAHGTSLDDLGTEWSVFRKPASYAVATEKITGYIDSDNPVTVPLGSEFSTADGKVFQSLSDLTFDHADGTDDDGDPVETLTTQVMSTTPGYSQNVQANTIVNSDEIDGLKSCTNTSQAIGGNSAEPDSSLRKRIMAARTGSPRFSDNGIISNVRSVSNVTDVKLVDNRELKPDRYGNPGKSIHLYTIGGDDDAIADKLFENLYPTTKTVGKITKTVTSTDGSKHQINFDKAEPVNVYVHVHLNVDHTKFNGDTEPEAIRQAVISYFATLHMGDPVMFSKLFACGYSVPGVNEVSVGIGKDADDLKMADVPVSDFQLATTHDDPKFIAIDWDGDN